jgi:hypothetical protein
MMESFVRTSGPGGVDGLAGFAAAGFEATGFAGFTGVCADKVIETTNNALYVLQFVMRRTPSPGYEVSSVYA